MSSPYAHHSGTGGYSASSTPTSKQQRRGSGQAKFGGCCCAAPRGVSRYFFLFLPPSLPLECLLCLVKRQRRRGLVSGTAHEREQEGKREGQSRRLLRERTLLSSFDVAGQSSWQSPLRLFFFFSRPQPSGVTPLFLHFLPRPPPVPNSILTRAFSTVFSCRNSPQPPQTRNSTPPPL